MSKEVDTAALFTVGPLVNSSLALQTGVAYDDAGVDVSLYEETQAGVVKTALTLTTAGSQDWAELGDGYYTVEITAAQLNTAGTAWVAGEFTGILPFESEHYAIIDSTDATQLSNFLGALNGSGLIDSGTFAQMDDSVPNDGTIPTLAEAVYMIVQFLTERVTSGTDVSVKKVDGSTELFGLQLDDGDAPTSITRDV